MENQQYKRAVMLADSLTATFNKHHATYSEACWGAEEAFIDKHLCHFGIIPMVYYVDGKIVVKAELKGDLK